jgi:hypothetical protein
VLAPSSGDSRAGSDHNDQIAIGRVLDPIDLGAVAIDHEQIGSLEHVRQRCDRTRMRRRVEPIVGDLGAAAGERRHRGIGKGWRSGCGEEDGEDGQSAHVLMKPRSSSIVVCVHAGFTPASVLVHAP